MAKGGGEGESRGVQGGRACRESAAARGDAAKSFAFLISLFRRERAARSRTSTSHSSSQLLRLLRRAQGHHGIFSFTRNRTNISPINWDRAAALFGTIIFAFNKTQIAMTNVPAACGFLCFL